MKVTKVRTKDLIHVQKRESLSEGVIEKYRLNGWTDPIFVININGSLIIIDGHHRATAAGENIEVIESNPQEIREILNYVSPNFVKNTWIDPGSFLKDLKKSDIDDAPNFVKMIPFIK